MHEPGPIEVRQLFPETLDALLDLLGSLSPVEWAAPTACAGWTVKEVAAHLLGDEIGILSRQRDGYTASLGPVATWDELVAALNQWNGRWVAAAGRISPALLCDLLRFTGMQACAHFAARDPAALGNAVSWAGPDPAPVWLDLAREYTERWHHQQHIREVVGRPGLLAPRYLAPVLDAFVRALPHTYRAVAAPAGTMVGLTITGEAGGRWSLRREGAGWHLYLAGDGPAQAEAILPAAIAWRLFTKGMGPDEARLHASLHGDAALAGQVLTMVSIIA